MSEIEENFQKDFGLSGKRSDEVINSLEKICDGLIYISEIDSPVTVFIGRPGNAKQHGSVIEQAVPAPGETVREINFDAFFDRLTRKKDWHGEREHVRTKKFLDLRKLIEEKLTEPKAFKIGDTNVRIVAAGLDPDGVAVGVTMDALET